jgi:hypothetical protein
MCTCMAACLRTCAFDSKLYPQLKRKLCNHLSAGRRDANTVATHLLHKHMCALETEFEAHIIPLDFGKRDHQQTQKASSYRRARALCISRQGAWLAIMYQYCRSISRATFLGSRAVAAERVSYCQERAPLKIFLAGICLAISQGVLVPVVP